MNRKGVVRRIACYGWVEEGAGSVASGNYLLLRELLERGVEVDFYAHRQHVPPPRGLQGDLRYLGFDSPVSLERLPARTRRVSGWLLSPYVARAWRKVYEPVAQRHHRETPYDVVLSLGTPPAFAIPGVPTVTWLQGPQHTELEAIERLRNQIERVSGRAFYASLLAYYTLDGMLQRSILDTSDRVICGSEWARQAILSRRPGQRVHALPYPIDLDAFRPAGEVGCDWERPVILSLGRLDPRKRLDLLLDAFELVRERWPGARLRIVGRPGYAPRQLSLVERFPARASVDYEPAIPRASVPEALRRAAVLVQPSENENFGSAVAEALACGVPAVVGPRNGTAEYLDESSEVFERYMPESVARAIVAAVERRRADADAVRASARASAERWFAPEVVADRLLAVCAEAVQASRRLHPSAGRAHLLGAGIETP